MFQLRRKRNIDDMRSKDVTEEIKRRQILGFEYVNKMMNDGWLKSVSEWSSKDKNEERKTEP